MAAPGFAFLLLCMTMSTIGSELKPWSDRSIEENIMALNQKVLDMEYSMPLTIRATNAEMLLYISDKIANNSEVHEASLKVLLSEHSLRVELLEKRVAQCDEVTMLEQNLRDQTLRIEKLSQQLEDVQSALACTGEPPSPQNGRTVHFERKHGSVVQYRCDVNFDEAENSTVRCHLGKWEGRPPLCTRPASSALSLHVDLDKDSWTVANVSCSAEENGQHVRFSRVMDTGTGLALPTAARTFTRDEVAVLDLSGVSGEDKRGLFQCGHVNRTGVTFGISQSGFFLRPQVASVGDNVTIGYYFVYDHPSFRWLHDGQRVPAWDGRGTVDIAGVGEEDAGVYEQYKEGSRRGTQYFFRLVMRGCPAGFFGHGCDQKCRTCYNGGLCDEELGTCVCAPGFKGRRCKAACGGNRIGPDCSEACDGGDCSLHLFCRPDPYGCSCAAGYRGYYCNVF